MNVLFYRCSNGHEMQSTKPLNACVGCVDGKPCDGDLRRLGATRKTSAA